MASCEEQSWLQLAAGEAVVVGEEEGRCGQEDRRWDWLHWWWVIGYLRDQSPCEGDDGQFPPVIEVVKKSDQMSAREDDSTVKDLLSC